MEKPSNPVILVTKGCSGEKVAEFKAFLSEYTGAPNKVEGFVADMSPVFLAGTRNFFSKVAGLPF